MEPVSTAGVDCRVTVIAWDGETLAADTYCTTSDGDIIYGPKIYETPCGLYGGAGDDPAIELVRLWLMKGGTIKKRPPAFGEKVNFIGLLIDRDRDLFILDNNILPVRYFPQKFAIGTGGKTAMALMHCGHSAAEAVQKIISDKLVDGCGGEVQTLTLKKKKGGIRKSCS